MLDKKLFNLCLKIASAWSLFGIVTFAQTPVFAQSPIASDNTLGAESSQIIPNFNRLPVEVIIGGATRGINLFHSFQEFNVSEGRGAYFFSPSVGIQNILARVTGKNRSEILGRLGTFQIINGNIASSNANLFLINPNGIIFGKNASLDINGSFAATTANVIQFGDRGNFSATNPEVSQLLTINPSAFLFSQINKTASIQNNSVASAGVDPAGLNTVGLRVPNRKSLLLVGGHVIMDGGRLNAYGGRIELGGLAEPGNINLFLDDGNLRLGLPENVVRADVSLINQSGIYVQAAGGGNIAINARNIEISGVSLLLAGIGEGLGTAQTVAGDITLNATGEIKVADVGSGIGNLVASGSHGNGGNISIDAGSLSLKDGAQINASTFGRGNAGNVTVRAKEAVSLVGQPTAILSRVEAGGVGKGGNIDVNAASLSIINGAQLGVGTLEASTNQSAGQGDAGNINIQVAGAIDIAGEKNGFISGISSRMETGTEGNGGNITIDSGSFSLRDGAQLVASTYGKGNAGDVTVRAKGAVFLVGQPTAILSTVEAGGMGKGGNININAASLSLYGAQLQTITRRASVTQPAGRGDAGNVNVKVTGEVNITGKEYGFLSGIFSLVATGTEGNGGNITIDSGSFSLRDGAQLQTSTFGQGSAGNIYINAKESVTFSGTNRETGFSSGLFTFTGSNSTGQGADINVTTNLISISNGAVLDAGSASDKRGGNITINTNILEAIDGGQLITTTLSNGRAGFIAVNAKDKVILSGSDPNYNDRMTNFPSRVGNIGANSGFFVSSTGSGITGDIEINSPNITLDNQAKLNAESASGNGGNINLNSNLLFLRRGAQMTTNAGTAQQGGDGGNIDINSKFVIAIPTEDSDITANAFTGRGGNVQINSRGIFGIEVRSQQTEKSDITASSNLGVAGVINLIAPDTDSIQNNLAELSQNPIDTQALIANSCIARSDELEGTFTITGSGGLPYRPGDASISSYPTSDVRNVQTENASRPWQKGDPIVEPTGVYRLPNGQLVMSRECQNN